MDNKSILMDFAEKLKDLSQELDYSLGSLNLNRETFKNINTELGRISEDINETDMSDLTAMGLRLRDIDHSIHILADLMHYTTEALNWNFNTSERIKGQFFHMIVSDNNLVGMIEGIYPSNKDVEGNKGEKQCK